MQNLFLIDLLHHCTGFLYILNLSRRIPGIILPYYLILSMLFKGLQRFLIKLNKRFMFFRETNFAMVFWLIRNVFTNFINIRF